MNKGIVKIWVCRDCEKEYIERPLMCTNCSGLEFYVKYGGIISDTDGLTDLVDSYKEDKPDKNKRIRM